MGTDKEKSVIIRVNRWLILVWDLFKQQIQVSILQIGVSNLLFGSSKLLNGRFPLQRESFNMHIQGWNLHIGDLKQQVREFILRNGISLQQIGKSNLHVKSASCAR
jgi:hypothetical protein